MGTSFPFVLRHFSPRDGSMSPKHHPTVSRFRTQPIPVRPDNDSGSDFILRAISKLEATFGLDSFIPCQLTITVAAQACNDDTILRWLTKYEVRNPALIGLYKQRADTRIPYFGSNPSVNINLYILPYTCRKPISPSAQ